MANYTTPNDSSALVAMTLKCNTVFNGYMLGIRFMDEGSTLGARRYKLQRSTGGVTPGTSFVARSTTRITTTQISSIASWGTNPTPSGNPLIVMNYVCTAEASLPILNWAPPNPRYPVCIVGSEQIDLTNNTVSTQLGLRMNWSHDDYRPASIKGRRLRKPGFYSSFFDSHFNAQGTATVPRQSITNASLLCGSDWQNTDDAQSSNQVFQNLLIQRDIPMFDLTPGTSIVWKDC